MKFCEYMNSDWFKVLEREVGASNKTRVAEKMDVSRSTLSAVMNGIGEYGKGKASTVNFEREFRRAYEQLPCPYNGTNVGTTYCREHALSAAPTHNPLQMMHWQACQQCSHKPRPAPAAAPIQQIKVVATTTDARQRVVAFNGKATSGDDAYEEGWNSIGGPNDNPYLTEDSRSDYWDTGYRQRRDFDKKQQRRIKQLDEPPQQAGIVDKVTLPLPEVGAPQIASEFQPAATASL